MQLISARRGFATNSSSSHSLIFVQDPKTLPDYNGSGDFGWDYFVQKTPEEKMAYFYQMFKDNFGEDTKEMADYFEVPVKMIDKFAYDGYIDHQSAHFMTIEQAKAILFNDNFAILGGNDNSESPSWTKEFQKIDTDILAFVQKEYQKHIVSGKGKTVLTKTFRYQDAIIALEKGVVTVFCTRDGTKLRFNMESSGEVYLSTPELVDIKITDYCPYGCSYCYQDSTVDGLHADIDTLKSMIDNMKSNGVFELAIGGGEPTLHPDFIEILEYCSQEKEGSYPIIPNFTTRNLSVFTKNMKNAEKIMDNIGGFAFSIDDSKGIKTFFSSINKVMLKAKKLYEKELGNKGSIKRAKFSPGDYMNLAGNMLNKASIQVVLGSMSRDEYKKTMKDFNSSIKKLYQCEKEISNTLDKVKEKAEERDYSIFYRRWDYFKPIPTVMLLGYKTTGRGSQPEYDYSDNALSDIKEMVSNPYFDVGIDTAAAVQLSSELQREEVPKEFYYVKEGVASCYIDAVANTMSSSSYCPEVENGNMDIYSKETFIDNFNQYQKKGFNAISIANI